VGPGFAIRPWDLRKHPLSGSTGNHRRGTCRTVRLCAPVDAPVDPQPRADQLDLLLNSIVRDPRLRGAPGGGSPKAFPHLQLRRAILRWPSRPWASRPLAGFGGAQEWEQPAPPLMSKTGMRPRSSCVDPGRRRESGALSPMTRARVPSAASSTRRQGTTWSSQATLLVCVLRLPHGLYLLVDPHLLRPAGPWFQRPFRGSENLVSRTIIFSFDFYTSAVRGWGGCVVGPNGDRHDLSVGSRGGDPAKDKLKGSKFATVYRHGVTGDRAAARSLIEGRVIYCVSGTAWIKAWAAICISPDRLARRGSRPPRFASYPSRRDPGASENFLLKRTRIGAHLIFRRISEAGGLQGGPGESAGTSLARARVPSGRPRIARVSRAGSGFRASFLRGGGHSASRCNSVQPRRGKTLQARSIRLVACEEEVSSFGGTEAATVRRRLWGGRGRRAACSAPP